MANADNTQEPFYMHSGPDMSPATCVPEVGSSAVEPIAIVGVGALYPEARGAADYWRFLTAGPAPEHGVPPPRTNLADVQVDVARFGIPPAQAPSMARMQLLMLETARQCLEDAGYAERPLPSDRTDVIVGTCFGLDRQYANALRIEGSRYARELERVVSAPETDGSQTGAHAAEEFLAAVLRRLGASPHDRIGEMASTIPARIATAFNLRGRTLALESADATSYMGMAHAVDSLRQGVTDTALVVSGQRHEGPVAAHVLAAKGMATATAGAAADWLTPDGDGFVFSEGVGALLLRRLSSAERDGDRVYASILDCTLRHDARPGVFRYSTSAARHREAAAASYDRAHVRPDSVQYVECAGYGMVQETHAEIEAHTGLFGEAAPASVACGSVRDRLGHTFANAGLASVSKVALALHRRRLPPQRVSADVAASRSVGALRTVPEVESWERPYGGEPRRAVISGASLTGTLCHMVLEEHGEAVEQGAVSGKGGKASAGQSAVAGKRRRTARPEPIAVIGYGGRFGDMPDADAFWDGMLSGRGRIGPVPEALLDRELYHSPGAHRLNHSYADQGSPMTVPASPPSGLRIPPRRYAALDPAQRVALAVAGEVFARGVSPGTLTGRGMVAVGSNLGLSQERHRNTGLCLEEFEGLVRELDALGPHTGDDVEPLLKQVREAYGAAEPDDSPSALDGCLASGVAALIANEYGLAAAPVAVEAACASSLAAVDTAVSSLRAGSADFALAGGVELPCNARDMILCSALGLLSRDRITPFDVAADGFTPGDGCSLFLLKRYGDARRDGDPVFGLLRGVGASNDAKSLIAPDVEGQTQAILQAFEQVEFDPSDVGYLEAHGTGTRVGDRIEMAATARVYGSAARRGPLRVGSAKAFVGHTFAAAGGAGLLRALQAIAVGTLPPHTGLSTVNPELELDRIPARIPTRAAPWASDPGQPRRAGVSSFGTGGINYHLLIEEHRDGSR